MKGGSLWDIIHADCVSHADSNNKSFLLKADVSTAILVSSLENTN